MEVVGDDELSGGDVKNYSDKPYNYNYFITKKKEASGINIIFQLYIHSFIVTSIIFNYLFFLCIKVIYNKYTISYFLEETGWFDSSIKVKGFNLSFTSTFKVGLECGLDRIR